MKVSINWIKDFVDLQGVDIENLISKFTMGVAEVEGAAGCGYRAGCSEVVHRLVAIGPVDDKILVY